jgi:hypothetical protein
MQPEENNQESVDPKSMYQDPGLTETRASAEEIVGGAKQEDQLDKFKQAVENGGRDNYPDLQSGVQPDAYQTPKERGENN